MTIHLKKNAPPWGASLVALLMLATLLALGTWQVKRLAWKTALLHNLAQAYRSDPDLTLADFADAARHKTMFLHGHITGHLAEGQTILIGPRTHEGMVGYHALTPLRLDTGGAVLVNRGWIPAEKAKQSLTQDGDKDVRITGLARLPDRANIFTPDNQPDSGVWYSVDMAQISTRTGSALPAYVLYAEQIDGKAQTFPLTFDRNWRPPNSHLQYAVFWFTMAGALILVFILRFFLILS
jgi:surfeit locus 1 family protein